MTPIGPRLIDKGDAMKGQVQAFRIEPRWPVGLAVLAVAFLLTMLPGRIRVFPFWVPYALGIALLVPLAAVTLAPAKARWLRIERTITVIFFVVTGGGTLVNLAQLIAEMAGPSGEISGSQLLTSGIAIWINAVLAFSLLYWQIDRGGPEARANNMSPRPDWFFPQEEATEDVAPDWRPSFVDYLFLGYSTATAFSPTDALPLTSRAKLLMMLESAISLVTIIVVVSRAINILGT